MNRVAKRKKFLFTKDSHFVDELSERYVIDLGSYFHLWSGLHTPFFEIQTVKTPEHPEGIKTVHQLRPLPLKDLEVARELKLIRTQAKALRESLASCVEVNRSGPLRSALAALKKPLLKSIHNFESHCIVGLLRRHFYDVQPGARYVWDILPSV